MCPVRAKFLGFTFEYEHMLLKEAFSLRASLKVYFIASKRINILSQVQQEFPSLSVEHTIPALAYE